MSGILEELGGAGAAKRARLAHKRIKIGAPPAVRDSGARMLEQGVRAYLGAEASRGAVEQSRPNCAYSLITATPATAIASGASTGVLSFALPEDTWIVLFSVSPTVAADFVCTSLKVAGYDLVKGSPINLAAFTDTVDRIDRPGPLVGRKFGPGVTVEGSFVNTNAAAKVFTGMTVHCISPTCMTGKRSKPAPGIFSFQTLTGAFRRLWTPKSTRMIR